ncbi:glycophorin-C-like isoform X5 [Scleropages formosus]|uniref:glycophorin-C-like isoform X5 n=1 Tax=Scleropages formosus TaxID=113540 RepID=UPI00062F0FF8|nr:glycophorin-C-like isoform X5 [Scleropages formosus]
MTAWHRGVTGANEDNVSFDAILGGVIAAVTLVLLCTAAVLLRYKYRHNGSYRTNEAKGTEFGRTSGTAPGTDPSARDAVDERGKEFFI